MKPAGTSKPADADRPHSTRQPHSTQNPHRTALLDYIRDSVVGGSVAVAGPFGDIPVVYADYTASGRSLSFIEDYIAQHVLPLYANTHTESSGTGRQTSHLRDEARTIIANSLGATDDYAVIFCGSGATSAVDKLIGVLGLRIPSNLDDQYSLSAHIATSVRPVIFVGPYEHHSNELPWRETIADVVTIDEDSDGHLDLKHLEAQLQKFEDRPLLIGSFSAASNVTGIVTDSAAVSRLLHRYGALAFWDFAAAAPYVDIDVDSGPDTYFDAIFLSPHKFIGGPGTPGLLVARRELFTNRVPDMPGGGTVAYVNPFGHDYVRDPVVREEGGTPDIIGSIRAGLVFQLKDAVGTDTIGVREEALLERAIEQWEAHPNLEVLGNLTSQRLSIVSFVVKDPDASHTGSERFLHHNFVVAVLNDVFGIQSRGGCSCAGPYGHRLLGIDPKRSAAFQREIGRGCEGIKPGWVRVSFNYFIDDETHDYIIDAVSLVADRAHELLPYYNFSPDSGLWTVRSGLAAPELSLDDISYQTAEMVTEPSTAYSRAEALPVYLSRAIQLFDELGQRPNEPLSEQVADADFEELRWFRYPHEGAETTQS